MIYVLVLGQQCNRGHPLYGQANIMRAPHGTRRHGERVGVIPSANSDAEDVFTGLFHHCNNIYKVRNKNAGLHAEAFARQTFYPTG